MPLRISRQFEGETAYCSFHVQYVSAEASPFMPCAGVLDALMDGRTLYLDIEYTDNKQTKSCVKCGWTEVSMRQQRTGRRSPQVQCHLSDRAAREAWDAAPDTHPEQNTSSRASGSSIALPMDVGILFFNILLPLSSSQSTFQFSIHIYIFI